MENKSITYDNSNNNHNIITDLSINSIEIKTRSCETNMEVMTVTTPKHIKEKIIDNEQNIISIREKQSDDTCFNRCIILNYIIISFSLFILSFILYNLTNEIRNVNTEEITTQISYINENLQDVTRISNTLQDISYFTKNIPLQNIPFHNIPRIAERINETLFNLQDLSEFPDTLQEIFIYIKSIPFENLENVPDIIQRVNQTLFNLEYTLESYNQRYIGYSNIINQDTASIPTNDIESSTPQQNQPPSITPPNIVY